MRCARRSLVTYDQFGHYGHPDHIQAHRVATYGADLAAVPSTGTTSESPGTSPRSTGPRCRRADAREPHAAPRRGRPHVVRGAWTPTGPLPMTTPDADISTAVDGATTGSSRSSTRCVPTAPRSPSTVRSSRSPTTSGTGSGAPSSSGSPRDAPARPGRTGFETDLFAGL